MLHDFVATVSEVRDIAADTRRVLLTLDEPLTFSAGQYVDITVPGTSTKRQYSLANPPTEPKLLELHVRRQPGGVASEWLFGPIEVGDRIDMTGPYGDFTFDEENTGPMALLGGGTGLAPLKGIVRHALTLNPDREILLYHGVRTCADVYDADFFRELASRHSGLRYVTCVSRENGGDREATSPTLRGGRRLGEGVHRLHLRLGEVRGRFGEVVQTAPDVAAPDPAREVLRRRVRSRSPDDRMSPSCCSSA